MVRFAALLGFGALLVHQLRYLLAGSTPDSSVHGYLGPAGSLLAGFMVLAIARAALGRSLPAPPLRRLWPGTSLALVAVYCVQETAEGVSPLAHGGWLAMPIALVVGLGIALLTRATRGAVRPARPWRSPSAAGSRALPVAMPALRVRSGAPRVVLARGPPCTSS